MKFSVFKLCLFYFDK